MLSHYLLMIVSPVTPICATIRRASVRPLKLFRLIRMSGTVVAATILCLSGTTSYAGQQDQVKQLNHRVLSLTQQCDDTRSKNELLAIIAEIDDLIGQIERGHQIKKKLYVIRLKKSRNMCQYFLQLRGG